MIIEADVKGDAYEGLLQKNAEDVKGGAGQYFTPRALIAAIVDVVGPKPGEVINDPACGTGGFLLATHYYITNHYSLDKDEKKHLKLDALSGTELVAAVARLCVMNLYLHGIGGDESPIPDGIYSPAPPPRVNYQNVLTHPPLRKKSTITGFNEDGANPKKPPNHIPDHF